MFHRIALGVALLLGGCSLIAPSPRAQSGQPKMELLVQASEGLNPNAEGRPAPILLRIYELRAPRVFNEADFFALSDTDRATLGADLIGVDQVVLRPGERYNISRSANPETRVIGVFAGYRDLPHSIWRAVHLFPPSSEARWYHTFLSNQSVDLQIDLQPNSILVTDRRKGGRDMQPENPPVGATTSGNDFVPATPAPNGLDDTQSLASAHQPKLIQLLPESPASGEGAKRRPVSRKSR